MGAVMVFLIDSRQKVRQYLTWLVAIGLGIVLLARSSLGLAAFVPLDQTVAIVNNQVIMASTLNQRVAFVRANLVQQGTPLPAPDVLSKQVLNHMVLEDIQLQLAHKAGFRVSAAELTQALNNIARQNQMNLVQFKQQVESEGVSYEELREQIKREILIHQIQQKEVGGQIVVTQQEVDNFLANHQQQLEQNVSYHLAHILIAVPEDATPGQIQSAQRKAEALVKKLQQGANFKQLAISDSDGPNALKGGDLGWRSSGELPGLFVDAVANLKAGQITTPLRSPNGFHILQLLAKKGGDNEYVEQTHVRHILIKTTAVRDEQQAKDLVNQLRQQIVDKKASFAQLARKFSDDPVSAAKGGDLGWVESANLAPAFSKVMNDAALDKVSQPFMTQYGWHILEVLGRRQVNVSDQVKTNKARQYVYQRKYQQELQAWLRKIKSEAYIDIKADAVD
jgi:peptidyl-prolyl cis-trans isomerase SurA